MSQNMGLTFIGRYYSIILMIKTTKNKKEYTIQPSKEPDKFGGFASHLAIKSGFSPVFAGSYAPRKLYCRYGGVCYPEFDREIQKSIGRDISQLAKSRPALEKFTGCITIFFMKGGLPLKLVFTSG